MSAPTEALAIALIADADIASVAALWQRCDLTRPWNDPSGDIAFARRGPNSAVLVGRHADAIVATVMVGHDGHRGWFYYLAVDPALQGRGFGRTMTQAAEAWLVGRGSKASFGGASVGSASGSPITAGTAGTAESSRTRSPR